MKEAFSAQQSGSCEVKPQQRRIQASQSSQHLSGLTFHAPVPVSTVTAHLLAAVLFTAGIRNDPEV